MCGILSIVNIKTNGTSHDLLRASSIIRHRGPDDEGFLTWTPGGKPKIWAGGDTAKSTFDHYKYEYLAPETEFRVALGHRRLSILDLSPAGHQPMVHAETGVSMVFNGEIYNFAEIKLELEAKGYTFYSHSDSEVLLLAWVEWGKACLPKLNGMFSFVILDPRNGGKVFAIRDRFGVKPLYWTKLNGRVIFCSEIKQIRVADGYRLSINKEKVFQYLAHGLVDTDEQTFDTEVYQLKGGTFAEIDLVSGNGDVKIERWYHLKPKAWTGTEALAIDNFRALLQDSVRLRMRADVPVGSCLSGGLDSSAIVCLARRVLEDLGDHKGQKTVTACYSDPRFDEWKFAEEVVKQTEAEPHRIFPSFDRLTKEFETLLWHQDDPFPSTSMFSQWCVFAGAAEVHLKVMIDGQGSDEQLAGYGGNDLALYIGLLKKGKYGALWSESRNFKKTKGHYPIGFVLGALQDCLPKWSLKMFPAKYRVVKPEIRSWLKVPTEQIQRAQYDSLQSGLIAQVLGTPLPSLLRFEDRSSMAWSIESRVPFMDYRFVEFTLGLPENFVYKDGLRKTILRKAMRGVMPDMIVDRTDKMGFVTPEELWLREEGTAWFRERVTTTLDRHPEYFDRAETLKILDDMVTGKIGYSFVIWRVICFGQWMRMMQQYGA